MKIGAHVWVGNGLNNAGKAAVNIGCQCIQIFLHNPRSWKISRRNNDEMIGFTVFLKENNIQPLAVHMPYLLNLASPDRKIFSLSIKRLEIEMEEAEKMVADFYIIHPGSCPSKIKGIKQLCEGLKNFTGLKTRILIENTSGQGNSLGGNWQDFEYLFQKLEGIGICFDTAHAFASGNDFRTKIGFRKMISDMEKYFPRKSIFLVHANDSLSECGSRIDRHQHLGKGFIGKNGFKILMKDQYFSLLPFIIETPKTSLDDDRQNLKWLKKITGLI
ncbi:MAG: deoxyribonuclease IV [bacterium]|nr:deoxyribonuclease IV [bacterium]